MVDFPAIPPGVDPVAFLNWIANNQRMANDQARRDSVQQQGQTDALSAEYQRQQDLQRAAVENRYNDILSGLVNTRERVLGDVNQFGQSLISDTNRDFKKQAGDSVAALSRAGLLGSTVRSSVESRNQREKQDALRRDQDVLLQNRIAADERTTNRITDTMERRNDMPPNLQQLIDLQNRLGMGNVRPQGRPGMIAGPTAQQGSPPPFPLSTPMGYDPATGQYTSGPSGYRPNMGVRDNATPSYSYDLPRPAAPAAASYNYGPNSRDQQAMSANKFGAQLAYKTFHRSSPSPDLINLQANQITGSSGLYQVPAMNGAITNSGESLMYQNGNRPQYYPIPYPMGGTYQQPAPPAEYQQVPMVPRYQTTPASRRLKRRAGPILDADTRYDQMQTYV